MHRPKKYFGQHFLHDQNVIAQIITHINPQPNEHFVEIGPGLGALTSKLLPLTQALDVVEIDKDVIPQLQQICRDLGTLRVHLQDVLDFDFAALPFAPLRVVGNLPYNISTPLLFHVIKNINIIKDMHFMVQKEVALRLAAVPGSKVYGRLSVMAQYFCEVELLLSVDNTSFSPPPKVDSAVVSLVPNKNRKIIANDIDFFGKIVAAAFTQRRKTIGNSLKKIININALKDLGIDPILRPEQLSVEQFVAISNTVET